MHTEQLNPNQPQCLIDIERSEVTAIKGEIVSRIIEISEITSRAHACDFVQKLNIFMTIDKGRPFWTIMAYLSGDLDAITKSYIQEGIEHGKTKQAVQQGLERAIAVIGMHFPRAKEVIVQMRHITAQTHPDLTHKIT